VSDELQTELLESATQSLEQEQALFITGIENKEYKNGCDRLGLSIGLLEELDVTLSIDSIDDSNDLASLSPDDIKACASSYDIMSDISVLLCSLDNFVSFAVNAKPAALEAILSLCAPSLTRLDFRGKQVAVILNVVDEERRASVLTAFKGQFKLLYDVNKLLLNLSPEFYQQACSILKDNIIDRIKNFSDCNMLVSSLNVEQTTAVYDALEEHLFTLVVDESSLQSAWARLPEAKIIELANRNPIFVRSISALSSVVNRFPWSLISAIYKAYEKPILTLCDNDLDTVKFLILSLISKHPYSSIKEFHIGYSLVRQRERMYLDILFNTLSDEQCSNLCGVLGANLPTVIETVIEISQMRSDIGNLQDKFKTTLGKKAVLTCYFQRLLHAFSDILPDVRNDKIKTLIKTLDTAYHTHIAGTKVNYSLFDRACVDAIDEAKEQIKGQEELLIILNKWTDAMVVGNTVFIDLPSVSPGKRGFFSVDGPSGDQPKQDEKRPRHG